MKVLIDFYATWCQPCKAMKPIIESLEKDGASVLKVDVDLEPEKVRQYGVMSIPTYIAMEDDKELGRKTGSATKEELETLLQL